MKRDIRMTDRETIIKGLEWWVKHQEGEVLPLAYSAVVETLKVLKEQEAMSWINVKDGLPNENGSYLVVYKAFQYALMSVKKFAKDLYSVDEYDFPNEHRPGWYEYDDEYGYIERNDITHWMPLPNLPEEGR